MAQVMRSGANRGLIAFLVLALLAIIGWAILTMPDRRTAGEKVGDAVDALPQGVDKAAQQLENRTPGERLGDAVKDTGDDIKQSTKRD